MVKKLILYAVLGFLAVGCSVSKLDKRLVTPDTFFTSPDSNSKFLKIHLNNGWLAMMRSWEIHRGKELIYGTGRLYNDRRKLVSSGEVEVRFQDIVLFESNYYEDYNILSPLLTGVMIVSTAANIICLADPKACFGSCPTFYLNQNDSLIIQGEGFSSSITPSMEATDIDKLTAYVQEPDQNMKIELKNEAYETHYIRSVALLGIQRPEHSNIHCDGSNFYVTGHLSLPKKAMAGTRDIRRELSAADQTEYLSLSDSTDLLKQETIELEFDLKQEGEYGIVVSKRQSFLTTFLFYQSLAYMGTRAGEFMALYERSSPMIRNAQRDIYDLLGGIEVSVFAQGRWLNVGVLNEQGPITSDTHIVPFRAHHEFSRVRLTMSRALWRIDQVGVVEIKDQVEPVIIPVEKVSENEFENTEVLNLVNNSDEFLVNNPGASYTLEFNLPEQENMDYFLRSRGYYTEWIRSEWLKEEDPEMAKMLITKPRKYLRLMAPKFKRVESEMENLFWQSKFSRHEIY